MPTLEELCSLLERVPNEKGRFLSSLFTDKITECWTSDHQVTPMEGAHTTDDATYTVDFSKGMVTTSITRTNVFQIEDRCYLRAVRSIK